VILTLPDGEIAMHRRDARAPTAPGQLGLFGGGVEAEEDPVTTVVRELREETSLELREADVTELGVLHVDDLPGAASSPGLVAHIYLARIGASTFEVYEGVRAENYPPATLLRRGDVAPIARAAIVRYVMTARHAVL
jgi:8-oxo-dGTP pyrophosphatase MutT (NUDIX family)